MMSSMVMEPEFMSRSLRKVRRRELSPLEDGVNYWLIFEGKDVGG